MTVFWQDVERLAIYVMMVRQVSRHKKLRFKRPRASGRYLGLGGAGQAQRKIQQRRADEDRYKRGELWFNMTLRALAIFGIVCPQRPAAVRPRQAHKCRYRHHCCESAWRPNAARAWLGCSFGDESQPGRVRTRCPDSRSFSPKNGLPRLNW